jgi:hypothetical protein
MQVVKMNRLKITLRNIVIIIILFFLFLNRSGLYLTPVSAHESSERSIHYGPSEVVHVENYKEGKHILGKYDKWISCNTVEKELYFFWKFGSQVTGIENDKSKALGYSWNASHQYYKCYGIRNDARIEKVEIILYNEDVYETTDFYEDLFLITWESSDDNDYYIKNIKGYDKNNKIIFEENR